MAKAKDELFAAQSVSEDIVPEKKPIESVNSAEARRRRLRDIYADEPKVEINLSPLYAPYFGKVMQVSINGITIAFPVDGSTHSVPTSFANEINSRRIAIDTIIRRGTNMANVSNNVERYPGELSMF